MPFGGALALFQLTVLGWGAAGSTEPIAVRVEFEGPATCSDAARFYARVRARTERVRKAAPGEPGLDLRVRLQPPAGGKVHGELRILDERGTASTRKVDGASCEEVVEALSLTAALALDPSATLAPAVDGETPGDDGASSATASASPAGQGTPARDGATSATPKTSHAEKPASSTSESSLADVPSDQTSADDSAAPRFGVELGAALGLSNVVSPELSLGAAVFGRLRLLRGGRGSLGLALAYSGNDLLSSDETLAVRLTSLVLDLCPVRWESTLSLEPCALVSGGLLAASSSGISDPDSSLRSHFALGGLLRLGLPVGGRARIELEGGAAFPLLHRQYVLSEPERFLGETPGVSWLGTLGASYGF